jgi:hypothetical protein
MLRAEMSMRIGHVNVQGLSLDSWGACCALLGTSLDYLFVTETWFVRHAVHTRDRRLVASTPKPRLNVKGRPHGGIYLLATHDARSRATGIVVTEHTITFTRDRQVISGVYFPPTSLSPSAMEAALHGLGSSTILLGDINTRFKDREHQAGQAGPPERVAIFQEFMRTAALVHVKPNPGEEWRGMRTQSRLTTDHCFVHVDMRSELRLLDNHALRMDTDHQHTLHLTLSMGTAPGVNEPTPRFRTSRLLQPDVVDRIIRAAEQVQMLASADVDRLNTHLVSVCQEIARSMMGMAQPPSSRRPGKRPALDQTYRTSLRLYKEAASTSRENDVIMPTARAQEQGIDAMAENLQMFRERYQGRACPQVPAGQVLGSGFLTVEDIIEEITRQEAEKSCGVDGIHIRFIKLVKDTRIIMLLQQLYQACVRGGRTPRAWNRSEVHLLSKDASRPRDADNLRPISLICMFRKIFERLLLLRCQDEAWASLHPCQAGFRREYSTCTNAAVVHSLLASGARSTAIFLDLKAAFDMVDHQILLERLLTRGCPTSIAGLLRSLMCDGVESRLFLNGCISEWFPRTRGVLQGSPLSPWLFNLFIDELLQQMNTDVRTRICLFYADDGALVTHSSVDAQVLLNMVEGWATRNRLELRVEKCGYVSSCTNPPPLSLYGRDLLLCQSYEYLGFPMTAAGIDFPAHLLRRMHAAIGRANWLGLQSDAWGVAHRLRVYKQFLAPMFEYGAPLAWAWAKEGPANAQKFHASTSRFKELMSWIGHYSDGRHRVTANICGLLLLPDRFQHLHTSYQQILEQMPETNPLRQLMGHTSSQPAHSFVSSLSHDSLFLQFKHSSHLQPTPKTALARFLRSDYKERILRNALDTSLTRLILPEARNVRGLFMADICLSVAASEQELLFQYRRGVFMFNSICACSPNVRFRRGHETCTALSRPLQLTHHDKQQKWKMREGFLPQDARFTDMDFLLNANRAAEVVQLLVNIRQQLRLIYKKNQLEQGPILPILDE